MFMILLFQLFEVFRRGVTMMGFLNYLKPTLALPQGPRVGVPLGGQEPRNGASVTSCPWKFRNPTCSLALGQVGCGPGEEAQWE
jgi:hypothetical protein